MKADKEVIETNIGKFIDEELIEDRRGNRYLIETTKIPFKKEGSQTPWLLGISIDIRERIESQNKLEENRRILKEIINSLEHNIYLKDYNGRFKLVNKSCARTYGIAEEEMVGKTDYDFYSPELADEFRRIELEIVESGNAMIIPEEHSIDRTGRSFVKNVNKMPFHFSQFEKTGVLGINIDITEAKMAEIALKESETKYKTLMNQASDGIYLSDNMGMIIEANPKACEMFGYTMEEFIGKNIKDMSFSNTGSNFLLRIPDMKDKQSILLERKLKKKDGTPFTVELSVKLLNDGKHQAILRDITERKKLEGILKDSEKKFRALIENSSDVMLILSEELQIKFVSNSVSRILGFEAIQLIDGQFNDLVHAEEHDIINKLLSQTLGDPGANHTLDQLRVKNLNNEFRFFEIVAVNLISDKVINGIIVNCHDITKRKITENELINTNFELDSFVYKASHDLKAPLRSVMGLIKLAKLESKDINLNVYLDMMNKSVQSLDLFIKDLTQFSRNSRTEVEAKKINFNEIITDTLSNLKFMENAALINVVQDVDLRSDFFSDPTRISTIINNLISNAYKYHRFEDNSPYINITVRGDYDRCTIEVEDNGTGIDPLHIDKIFEMFYRASESSYGSGLGLYIVKNAINRLKGTIDLKSEINKGTKFTIVLPNLNNIEQL
jgi:hypothetical protein